MLRSAFDLARERGGRLVSATKSNRIVHTMPFWDEVATSHPDVEWSRRHVDALPRGKLSARSGRMRRPRKQERLHESPFPGDLTTNRDCRLVSPSCSNFPPVESAFSALTW